MKKIFLTTFLALVFICVSACMLSKPVFAQTFTPPDPDENKAFCFTAALGDDPPNINPNPRPSVFVGRLTDIRKVRCSDTYRIFNDGNPLSASKCYIVGISINPPMIQAPKSSALCREANGAAPDVEIPDGDGGGSPDSLETTDIFGTSREELQTCEGAECVNNNPITKMAIYAVNILGALVGVIAVAMIVLAGIQYSSSGGNPQTTAEAKKRIINVVIALAAFFFLWAFMQWVIPGGALSG